MTARRARWSTIRRRPTSSAPGMAMSSRSAPARIRARAGSGCDARNSPFARARSMSEPERDRDRDAGDRINDAYAWIDRMAPELLRASRELVENNEAARVSDEAVAQILTAAIRLYVAKSDGEERTFAPIAGRNDSELTPTE